MNIANLPSITNAQALGRIESAATVTGETVKKVIAISSAYLFKAALITRMTLHSAWSVTLNFMSRASTIASTIAAAVWNFAQTAGKGLKDVCQKIVQVAAKVLPKIAEFAAVAWAALKTGAAQSYQMTKSFYAAHPKEALIIGSFAAGMAAMFAISHLFAAHKAPTIA